MRFIKMLIATCAAVPVFVGGMSVGRMSVGRNTASPHTRENVSSSNNDLLDLLQKYETDSILPVFQPQTYVPRTLGISQQSEFGKPVKMGKTYRNASFSELVAVSSSISRTLTWGWINGHGKQLTPQEKKKYKVHVDNNGLYQLNEEGQKKYLIGGEYSYIVTPKGGFYLFDKGDRTLTHSSIRASHPVQAAGNLSISNKRIEKITPTSNYYLTTWEQLIKVVGGLYVAGFVDGDASCVERDYTESEKNVALLTVLESAIQYTNNSQSMDEKKSLFPELKTAKVRDLIASKTMQLPEPVKGTQELCEMMATLRCR